MILAGLELVGEDRGARDIRIAQGTIVAVTAERGAIAEEQAIRCDGAIAFPGLTNSHDHLEFNLYPALGHGPYPDYVAWGADIHARDTATIARIQRVPKDVRLRWGALKNMLCGVTSVAHHGSASDRLAGLPIGRVPGTSIHSLQGAPLWRWRLNAPMGETPFVFHVGEGTSARARSEIDDLVRWNLFRKPLVAVHAIPMRPEQAAHFRAVVWCPVSNELLYGTTTNVSAWKRRTAVLFGTDSTLTGGWNLWEHLRRARSLGFLGDRELFDTMTSTAAALWSQPGWGRLIAGARADVVVARATAKAGWDAFFAVNPEDILLVVKEGAIILQDRSLGLRAPVPGRSSVILVGASEKWVAEDVPELIAAVKSFGVEPNLPIAASTHERGDV